ncbi:hypothetical protein GBA52_010173 [Prunus armeniaca]|nr:hypothetical protein GBA52_010173 [Prunus armeniaca]
MHNGTGSSSYFLWDNSPVNPSIENPTGTTGLERHRLCLLFSFDRLLLHFLFPSIVYAPVSASAPSIVYASSSSLALLLISSS